MTHITEQPWFLEPFKWYEESEECHVVSLQISETKALDVLRGLYDIYINLQKNNMEEAISDLNAMAVIIIAHTLGYSDEVVEELLVLKATNEIDDFITSVLENG